MSQSKDGGISGPRNARAAAREERIAHKVARKFLNLCFAPWDPTLGADWYVVARRDIADRFFGQPERAANFARLLAATSPQADVRENVRYALDALKHLESLAAGCDSDWKPWIPCHAANVRRVIEGKPLRGPKVQAFAAALLGDDEAVVVDTWMLRAAGFGHPRRLSQNRSFRITARAIRIVADTEKLPATVVQARIWYAYRAANWTAKKGLGDGYLPIRKDV